MGLLGQQGFFLLWWISIVAVLVEPVPEYLYWLFGQVSSPLPLPWPSSIWREVKRHIQTVLVVRLATGHRQHSCRHTRQEIHHLKMIKFTTLFFLSIQKKRLREPGKVWSEIDVWAMCFYQSISVIQGIGISVYPCVWRKTKDTQSNINPPTPAKDSPPPPILHTQSLPSKMPTAKHYTTAPGCLYACISVRLWERESVCGSWCVTSLLSSKAMWFMDEVDASQTLGVIVHFRAL